MEVIIGLVIVLVMLNEVYTQCSDINGVCFHDIGNGHYIEDKLMSGRGVRQVIITVNNDEIYHLTAMPAEIGYMFEQDLGFSGPVIMAHHNTLCPIPKNGHNFTDKVVIAIRGDCFDEHKAILAAEHGAKGLVILNMPPYSDIKFAILKSSPCMPPLLSRASFAVTLIQTNAESDFILSHYLNGTIMNATIARYGPSVGDPCGLTKKLKQRSPYCSGYPAAHSCIRSNKQNLCSCGSMYDTVKVDGIETCRPAAGVDIDAVLRNYTPCVGYIYPGGSGCNNRSVSCSDFPATLCYRNFCYCQVGYTLVGTPGDQYAKCIPEGNPYHCVHVKARPTKLKPKLTDDQEKSNLQMCVTRCFEKENCYGFHYQLTTGKCITYKTGEIIDVLLEEEKWMFYKNNKTNY